MAEDLEAGGARGGDRKAATSKSNKTFLIVIASLALIGLLKVFFMHGAHSHLVHEHFELSKYIVDHGAKIVEQHTGQFEEQGQFYTDLIRERKIKTICESGFNAGHSALTFLEATPETLVYSFDIWAHQYSNLALKYLSERYPDRLTVLRGDTKETINEFNDMHHAVRCDLVHVDGSTHDGMTANDIKNFELMSHCGTTLIVDGTVRHSAGSWSRRLQKCSESVLEDWNALLEKGIITQVAIYIN